MTQPPLSSPLPELLDSSSSKFRRFWSRLGSIRGSIRGSCGFIRPTRSLDVNVLPLEHGQAESMCRGFRPRKHTTRRGSGMICTASSPRPSSQKPFGVSHESARLHLSLGISPSAIDSFLAYPEGWARPFPPGETI